MKKLVISGGPHTGKTTLHNELRSVFPTYEYIPEPATTVITNLSNGDNKYWRDIFDTPEEFCRLCLDVALSNEKRIPSDTPLAVYDRSIVDTVAYSRRDECHELIPIAKNLAKAALYDVVVFCEPVGILADRVESPHEATLTHRLLREAYEELSIPLISLKDMPVKERLACIRTIIDDLITNQV